MKNKKKIKFLIILVLFLVLAGLIVYSNSGIDVEYINIADKRIPNGFDGCTIVHVSDYHSSSDSARNRLITAISEQNPDYIFITGDVCDSIRVNVSKANAFLEQVSQIAPCYLVWGNHDIALKNAELNEMRSCAVENGIIVLENRNEYLERNGDKMLITGTDSGYLNKDEEPLKSYPEDSGFSIWLHHYPEDFKAITEEADADLIFTGHAHGGLIRLPFTDGLYAPGQGFFPKYTSGLYEEYGSKMLVSRGVGNSGYTLRLFDRFHLVVCTLKEE